MELRRLWKGKKIRLLVPASAVQLNFQEAGYVITILHQQQLYTGMQYIKTDIVTMFKIMVTLFYNPKLTVT